MCCVSRCVCICVRFVLASLDRCSANFGDKNLTKSLYSLPPTGSIAPKGQQNIAQGIALGNRPPPHQLQRPERAADYTKGNALREE